MMAEKSNEVYMKIIHEKDIRNGDIGLEDSSGFLPDAIHEFQGDRFNHAFIFIWIGGKLWVFEAKKQGCVFTLFSDYLKKQEDGECDLLILRPKNNEFSDIDWNDFVNFILPLTIKPYGFFNLLVLQPIKFIGKWFGKDWWLGGKNHTRSFICGELVAYIYNHFLGWFKEWFKLAPVKLHECTLLDKFKVKIKINKEVVN